MLHLLALLLLLLKLALELRVGKGSTLLGLSRDTVGGNKELRLGEDALLGASKVGEDVRADLTTDACKATAEGRSNSDGSNTSLVVHGHESLARVETLKHGHNGEAVVLVPRKLNYFMNNLADQKPVCLK